MVGEGRENGGKGIRGGEKEVRGAEGGKERGLVPPHYLFARRPWSMQLATNSISRHV